jgi:hypothetical protein
MMRFAIGGLVWVLAATGYQAPASTAPAGPAGHWEGAIETPGGALNVAVDLAARPDGKWEGTISIPDQHLTAFPLGDITVQETAVAFAMKGVPGNPEFKGTTSKDNKSITGQLSQGGAAFPFTLTWKGEAKIQLPPKSPAVSSDFEGTWQGTLNANGTLLRLTLKLANEGGNATGTLISVDQGGGEIPISSIAQATSHLSFAVPTIGGKFEGDLKDGQITGMWSQGPGALPLTFARTTK